MGKPPNAWGICSRDERTLLVGGLGSILSDVPAVIIVFLAAFPIQLISRSIDKQPYDWDGQLLSIKTPTRIYPEYSRILSVIVSDTVGGTPLGPPSIIGSDPNPLILLGLHIGASGVGSCLSIAVRLEGGELGAVTVRGVPPNKGNLGLFLVGRSHISSVVVIPQRLFIR